MSYVCLILSFSCIPVWAFGKRKSPLVKFVARWKQRSSPSSGFCEIASGKGEKEKKHIKINHIYIYRHKSEFDNVFTRIFVEKNVLSNLLYDMI
jgi:hypothetical protein